MQLRDIEKRNMPIYEQREGELVQVGDVWPDRDFEDPEALLRRAISVSRQATVHELPVVRSPVPLPFVSAAALIQLIRAAEAVLGDGEGGRKAAAAAALSPR